MSDDLPPGSVNLEDDGPDLEAPSPAPIAEAAAPPTEAVPAEAEKPAEVEAVEVGGERYVPAAALMAERKQRQELKVRAEKADALEAQVAEMRPYVEFLKANPDILKPREAPRAPEPTGPPAPDAETTSLAQVLDLYKADGSLDTAKAGLIRQLMRDTARAEAAQAVAPYQQQTAQQAAEANFQRVLAVKDASGQSPTVESVRAVWGVMPAQDLANPQVASVMAALALGLDRMRGTQTPVVPPPGSAPLVSESGGGARPRVVLSPLEERIASQRNIKAATWSELTKNHVAGRPTVLEDE